MRTILFVIISLFLSIDSFADVKISGRLFGSDGKPMKVADVIVTNVANRRDVNIYPVKADGSFLFRLSPNGIYNITFAGVNHLNYEFSLMTFDKDEEIDLEVKLSPYKIGKILDELYVIGSFNAFSFDDGLIEMKKQSDGTFIAEVPNEGDTLYYQILGAVTEPELRSINGTMSDAYIYDGGGDYRSILFTKDKQVKIIFDPSKLNLPYTSPELSSKSKQFNQYLAVQNEFNEISRNFWRKFIEEGGFDNEAEYDRILNTIFSTLENYYNEYDDLRIRVFALDKYINFSIYANTKRHKVNSKLVTEIFNLINPQSAFWSMYPFYTLRILNYDKSDKTKLYIQKIIDENKDKNATRQIKQYLTAVNLIANYNNEKYIEDALKEFLEADQSLYLAASIAYNSNDSLVFKALYKFLLDKYPDSWSAKRAKFEWDENRNIQLNKIIPDFKLASLDNPNYIITRETLKGKFILIDLWATWCGPCIGELPHLEKAYEKFKNKNFEIFSISFDRSPEIVKRFRQGKWSMPWIHAFAEGAFDGEIGQKFEVIGIPKPILIDPQGKIIALESDLRGNRLEKTLEKFIK